MSMKTLDEVLKEIEESVSVSKSGKIKKTFSRADYDRVLKTLMNTPEYKAVYCSTKNGELVKTEVEIVKKMRDSLKKVLEKAGLDKQAADDFMNNHQFTNVDGFYEVFTEATYLFMNANKKFDFPTREDFKGSISIKTVDESVGTFKSIRKPGDNTPPEEFKIKTGKHKVLEKKSKAPAWIKNKFK